METTTTTTTNTNNIIIKDRYGNDVVYEGVSRIRTGTTDGGTKEFVIADDIPTPVETTIELDFSEGDMKVVPEDGEVFSKTTITKPETLIPGNIAKDVEVAGVTGTLDVYNPIETTVELDFSEGNISILPDDGMTFSEVTIEKPESLIPENIIKDVEIAGVVGTLDIPTPVETTVELDFSQGDMGVSPGMNELFSGVTIEKPGTLIPDNIAEGVNIAGIIGMLKGGTGTEIKIATGTLSEQTSSVRVEHNLGVIPDFVYLQCATPSKGYVYVEYGVSSNFKALLGGASISSLLFGRQASGTYGHIMNSAVITSTVSSVPVNNATDTHVTFYATSTYKIDNGSTWFAIAGLTES